MGILWECSLITSLSCLDRFSLTFPSDRFSGWSSWQKLISRLTTILALRLLSRMLYHIGLIMVTVRDLWATCCCILFWLWRLVVPLWLWNPAFCTIWAPGSLTLLTMRWQILWLWLDQTIFFSWLSQNLVLIWLFSTIFWQIKIVSTAKQFWI